MAQWARRVDSTYKIEVLLNIRSRCLSYQTLFFLSWDRSLHVAVVMPNDRVILLGGSYTSMTKGEIVNSKFSPWYLTNIGQIHFHIANDQLQVSGIFGSTFKIVDMEPAQSSTISVNWSQWGVGVRVDIMGKWTGLNLHRTLSLFSSSFWPLPRYNFRGHYKGSLPDLATPRRQHACSSFVTSEKKVTKSMY